MADAKVNILVNTEDKASQELRKIDAELGKLAHTATSTAQDVNKLDSSLDGVTSSAAPMKQSLQGGVGILGNFSKALSTIGTVALTVGPAIAAFKVALDMGEAGAKAMQTAESFDYLIKKIGAAPDLLAQLREASNGTISDLDIMSSTSLLLAGAQGELATNLANATPALLEMAKAASKLNPALGDTTFLYDSLTRGIKRGSPMILDNLGIMISLEEANKKYADSLGIAVEALTGEQQKIALLNEVLAKGGVLLDQAGGTADSATDSFAQLRVNLEELGTAIKISIAPAIIGLVDALVELTDITDEAGAQFSETGEEVASGAVEYDQYLAAMRKVADEYGVFIRETEDSVQVLRVNGDMLEDVTDEFTMLSKAEFDAEKSAKAFAQSVDDIPAALRDVAYESGFLRNALYDAADSGEGTALALLRVQDAAEGLARDEGVLDRRVGQTTLSLQAQKKQLDALATAQQRINDILSAGLKAGLTGAIGKELINVEDIQRALDEVQSRIDEFNATYQGGGQNTEAYAGMIAEFDLLNTQLAEAETALARTTKEMIFNQAAAGLDADAALELARSFGLISESDYAVSAAVEALRSMYEIDGKITGDGAQAFAAGVEAIAKAVAILQDEGTDVTVENIADALARVNDQQVDTSETAQDLEITTTAATNLGKELGELPGTMDDTDQAFKDTKLEAEKLNDEFGDIPGLASEAGSAVDEMGAQVKDTAETDVAGLIVKLQELKTAVEEVPTELLIRVQQRGGDTILTMLRNIRMEMERILALSAATLLIPQVGVAAGSGGGGSSYSPPTGSLVPTSEPTTTINVINNNQIATSFDAETLMFDMASRISEYL